PAGSDGSRATPATSPRILWNVSPRGERRTRGRNSWAATARRRRQLAGDLGDVTSNSLPAWGDVPSPCARRKEPAGDPGDVASNSLLRRETFRLPTRGEKNPRATTALGQRGRRRLTGNPQVESPLGRREVLLLLFFFFFFFSSFSSFLFLPQSTADDRFLLKSTADDENQPSTTEIGYRRSILVLPPGSNRSTYRSAAGPVCTGRYESYCSVRKTLQVTLQYHVFTLDPHGLLLFHGELY
ncbi:hypothetical protein BHE74_00047396, partial [Ensete ventricosum]